MKNKEIKKQYKQPTVCPYCDDPNFEIKEIIQNENIKGQIFTDNYKVFHCTNCGEDIASFEALRDFIIRVYDKYKKANGLLTSYEIKSFRKAIGWTKTRLAEELGVNEKTIRRWENGELQPIEKDKHLRRTMKLYYNLDLTPDKKYSIIPYNETKIYNLIAYIIFNTNWKSTLFINKVLFFIDVYSYQKTDKPVTGITYRAIPYGPAPKNYDEIFLDLVNSNIIEVDNKYDYKVTSDYVLNTEIFTKREFKNINKCIEILNNMNINLVDFSHSQLCWLSHIKDHSLIEMEETKNIDFNIPTF